MMDMGYPLHLIDLLTKLLENSSLKSISGNIVRMVSRLQLRKESDKVVSFLRTCSTS